MHDTDYIIVGAGAAGCGLAARLTEDPNTDVVILEAGDKIQLQASQANAITMTAAVLQTSRT